MQSKNPKNIKIIDVSRHQDSINWMKVAADAVKGAFVKASEGVGYIDPMFRRNAVGAPAAGLEVGFYHYARPETGNTAKEEAESFIATIEGLPSKLPHVLDLEGASSALGRDKLTDWAYEWLIQVERLTGHTVMLYTGGAFARSYCGAKLVEFPLWIAHYGVNQPMNNPTWSRWAVFQYASDGRVEGISGNVDMNEMEVDFWMDTTKKRGPFPDVDADAWYAGAVKSASVAGLMSGYPDGTFKPDQPITRAELAVVLAKLKGDE